VARVFVGIGSNIDRERNIRNAITALRLRFNVLQLSRIYESAPIGFDGGNFYNGVCSFETGESPEAVTAALHEIERRLGRQRGPSRFAPRAIDLDLLLYENLVRSDPALRLPRPEIGEYACVLRPLAELAPERRHPLTGETFAQLWARFDQNTQPLMPVEFSPAPDG
jgi:2-amino-4-hydroxy-6-hydroxymethyldihydropteridine diphosphokinase